MEHWSLWLLLGQPSGTQGSPEGCIIGIRCDAGGVMGDDTDPYYSCYSCPTPSTPSSFSQSPCLSHMPRSD